MVQDAVLFFCACFPDSIGIRLIRTFARQGLDFEWIDLMFRRTADLQSDEGLEWIARELAAGTSAIPSAIVILKR